MNKKISIGITISLVAIACALTFVVTMSFSLNMYNGKIADVQQREEMYTKMQEIDSYIKSYSIYETDDTETKIGVYSGYLNGIDDKYAKYYTTNEYYYKTQLENGVLTGLGMELGREQGGYISVTGVYEDSPAYESGIIEGDVITSVGGVSVLELGYEAALSQLKFGDEGTKQRFKVSRSGEETEYNLGRRTFTIVSVQGLLLDNGVLYLNFNSLNAKTGEQIEEILSRYNAGDIKGYIFDLRDCCSNVYPAVSGVLNSFIGGTRLADMVYRNNSTKPLAETDGNTFTNLPISIIINERTGGAAELMAVSLRDFNNAKLVGAQTMGYGTIQEARAFSDGTAIEISVARVRTVNELSNYNENGISPEFAVEYTGAPEEDPMNYAQTMDEQLKKAVEVINISGTQ
ncbi:MAG: S41 family peptidase [Ruminiclostridium sp.]